MKKVGPIRDSSQKLVKTCSPGAAGVQELFREPGPMCPRRNEVLDRVHRSHYIHSACA